MKAPFYMAIGFRRSRRQIINTGRLAYSFTVVVATYNIISIPPSPSCVHANAQSRHTLPHSCSDETGQMLGLHGQNGRPFTIGRAIFSHFAGHGMGEPGEIDVD